jgi:hypothetical protein
MFDPSQLYKGFFISEAVGNNAFSYQKKTIKKIFVAPLVEGDLNDLAVGDKIAFCDIENDVQRSLPGLKNFVHLEKNGRNIFIFDNHNHAFFFWAYALYHGIINMHGFLVHVDQHSDMWRPTSYLLPAELKKADDVFYYTNYILNVGTFIKPAVKAGIFDAVEIIDGNEGLKKCFNNEIVLDIDMDFFASEMDFVPESLKIKKIKEYINQARFITIATSPFFMDQQKAIDLIPSLLD